jgi:putative membrane protein
MKHTTYLLALAGACTLAACGSEKTTTETYAASPATTTERPVTADSNRTPVTTITPPPPVAPPVLPPADPMADIDTRATDPVGTDAVVVEPQKKDESGTDDALIPPGLPTPQTPDGNTPPTDTFGDAKQAPKTPGETAALGTMDAEFIQKAAIGGLFEVESSELAVLQATTPFVRDFAQMMVVDHGDSNRQLETIAREKGGQMPKELDAEHQQRLNTLRDQKGIDFDRQYRDMQVTAHKDAIALFERASTSCEDRDLKAFATKLLPALREHQRRLNEMPPTEGS